jgi:hypothetical protein
MHLSVYSGYVKWSGLKGTTITLPHGLIGCSVSVLTRMMPVPYKWAISMLP